MRHGGDVESYIRIYKKQPIDFSSNINPLGVPLLLKKTIEDSVDLLNIYPDIQYRSLKSSLSKYLKCSEENIIVGNGVMELIDSTLAEFESVILVHPCFNEYESRAKIHGLEISNIILEENFILKNPSTLFEKIKKNQVIILGNPNNPTGFRLEKNFLLDLYALVKEKGAFLVLDEAFYEFTMEDYDSIQLFKNDLDNIMILRAATKFFALPGIRLGYGVTGLEIKKRIEERLLPWSVNTLAMKAGEKLHELEEYCTSSKEYFFEERNRLFSLLKNLVGITFYPSDANYILLRFCKRSGREFYGFMAQRGILVRTCENYRGLDDSYIRFAIKSKDENSLFVDLLVEFLKG